MSANDAQYRPTGTPLSRGARAIKNVSKFFFLFYKNISDFKKERFLIFQKIVTHRFTQTFWWYTRTYSPYRLVRT